ncbi:hypothetical protein DFH08DRAFT_1088243 [Mycena albidolilacea]|uniref:DUF6534 domain-containing protein n=1 Tax=Mycena albidolilacea TaxID=1033008 RepID=A0AAD6Z6I5_9AGAR|nr:hypothetical protein DFH08DRAFT_1088243 [Mycena albidolilacea]
MSPGSTLPPGFHIVELSGPLLLADLLVWGLFGTLSVQVYLYYQAFPKDRLSTKCLVYGVYALELVETIIITRDAFATFAYGFSDISALNKINFNWLTIPVMSGLVAFIGQSFYAYRVYVLSSKSHPIPVSIVVVSLISSIGGFITGGFAFQAGDLTRLNQKTHVAVGVWCGASALSDIIIAVCMTYYLSKSDTGFRQTRVLVSKVVRLTIETGSLTALAAVINLTLFFAFPDRTYYTVPAALMPKLYANSILIILNARFQIIGGRTTYASAMDVMSTPTYLRNTETYGGTRNHGSQPSHWVTIDREVMSDGVVDEQVEMKGISV